MLSVVSTKITLFIRQSKQQKKNLNSLDGANKFCSDWIIGRDVTLINIFTDTIASLTNPPYSLIDRLINHFYLSRLQVRDRLQQYYATMNDKKVKVVCCLFFLMIYALFEIKKSTNIKRPLKQYLEFLLGQQALAGTLKTLNYCSSNLCGLHFLLKGP